MKKNFKLILALVLSIMMVLGSVAALAEGETTYTVTINRNSTDKSVHTYGAFQVFTGKLETVDGKSILSDIQWGAGVTSATVIANLKKISTFESLADDASASVVAKAISDANLTKDSADAQAVAAAIGAAVKDTATKSATMAANASSVAIEGLAAGYYLVKDTAAVGENGAQTRFILEVVKNVVVNEKASVPSVTKKVKEKNDTTGVETDYQDAADYDIGDDVPFQITGTTADTADEYIKYHITFEDTSSEGLDAPANFSIAVLGQTLTLTNEKDTTTNAIVDKIEVTATVTEAGKNFKIKVTFENTDNAGKTKDFVKLGSAVESKPIVITYTAKLNSSAQIGSAGNPNEVLLKYSNNPNQTDDKDTDEGTTPKDKVTVFTYEIKALKVEPTSEAAITEEQYNALTTEQKKDYVKVGEKYQKTQALNGAGFTLYKKVPTTVDASGYVKIGDEIKGTATFEFKGTDAGEYKLVETTVPTGYNKANDITFKVEATYDTSADEPELKSLTVTPETAGFTVTTTTKEDNTHITTDGIITGKVLNQKGSTLPETGGIGTTIFYVAGSLMVLAAAILLITKRRMGAED